MTKRFGFTLAEVLITLAIIGVVAAMTLPTLVQKHQKKVLATKFQQSLSILSQGFQKMMADEGVTDFNDTEWAKILSNGPFFLTMQEHKDTDQYKLADIARQYFQVVDIIGVDEIQDNLLPNGKWNCKTVFCAPMDADYNYFAYVVVNASDSGYMTLKNGLQVTGRIGSERTVIDTNGLSGPNKLGYDTFVVYVLKNGLVVPDYSRAYEYENYVVGINEYGQFKEYTFDEYLEYFNYEDNIAKCKSHERMDFCGAYLYDKNNFVIDY